MDYSFKIAIVVFAYFVVIMGAYSTKLMLWRYEKEVETSGLKETFLFKKKPLLKKKGKNKRYNRMPNLLQGSMN